MALRNTYTAEDGTTLTAYYRIREVHTQYEKDRGDDADNAIHFSVEAYNDSTNERLFEPVATREANEIKWHSLDAADQAVEVLIDKAYAQLKTLAHFSEAEDC